MRRHFFSSLTRITNLDGRPFLVRPLDRRLWADGDYVVGEVICDPGPLTKVELPTGRYADLLRGDQVMGVLGVRCATLEAVGDWRRIGDDLEMHALTNAGLFGKCTSISPSLPNLTELVYRGHVLCDGTKATMKQFVQPARSDPFSLPVILMVGTSMSSGKTTSARVVIDRLRKMGRRVVAAKATGACRFGEILSMADSGANRVFDFVDVGLPSTVCPPEEFREAFRILLAKMSAASCDVAVVELGASPLEPYNGRTALEELESQVRLMIVCASDPYAVVGLQTAYRLDADLVSGVCTNTTASIDLIYKLTGKPSLNLLLEESLPILDRILRRKLSIPDSQFQDPPVKPQAAT